MLEENTYQSFGYDDLFLRGDDRSKSISSDTADSMFEDGSITREKFMAGTITATQLNFVPVDSTNIVASINASTEGILINAAKIRISGSTTFDSGYDPTFKLNSTGGAYTTTSSGARVMLFPDAQTGIVAYNAANANVFSVMVGGTDTGDVFMGNISGQYVLWDNSAGQLRIRGVLNADDIVTGTLNANNIGFTGTITGPTYRTAASGWRAQMQNANPVFTYTDGSTHKLSMTSDGNVILRGTLGFNDAGWPNAPVAWIGLDGGQLRIYSTGIAPMPGISLSSHTSIALGAPITSIGGTTLTTIWGGTDSGSDSGVRLHGESSQNVSIGIYSTNSYYNSWSGLELWSHNSGGARAGEVLLWCEKFYLNVNSSGNGGTSTTALAIGADLVASFTGPVHAAYFHGGGGNGFAYEVGDDAWLYDENIANTMVVVGNQSRNYGYLKAYIVTPSTIEAKENLNAKKKDVVTALNKLRFYEFNLKDEAADQKKFGVMVEELPDEMKMMVRANNGIDMYSYINFIARSVQQLAERIELLEKPK